MPGDEQDLVEKIRQQYDNHPFFNWPIEKSARDAAGSELFVHSLVTSYYLRNKKVLDPQDKLILDAGCASGYKSLILAEANPGSKVVGVDLSGVSIHISKQRLAHHGFETAEFYQLAIEEVPSLGYQFDYINCDEVLYLLPDPLAGLKALQSVLKPDGIIRLNFHNQYQRQPFFRFQEVFRTMGLMDQPVSESELDLVRATVNSLRDDVPTKYATWQPEQERNRGWILANYLIQGDKGYTIPQVFADLKSTQLDYINMVNWKQWDLSRLFQDPAQLDPTLQMTLSLLSPEDQLHLYELLQPNHRLIDFWTGHVGQTQPTIPVAEWTDPEWMAATVYLHPQLKTAALKHDLEDALLNHHPFEISRYVGAPAWNPIIIRSQIAACLLPLWDGAQSLPILVRRWMMVRPLNPVYLVPVPEEVAFTEVKNFLISLETYLFVLLEITP